MDIVNWTSESTIEAIFEDIAREEKIFVASGRCLKIQTPTTTNSKAKRATSPTSRRGTIGQLSNYILVSFKKSTRKQERRRSC